MSAGSALARRRRGQTLVESAMVLLVVLATLIGTLDFGQVVFMHQALVERARNAARYGALHWDDLVGTRNLVVYGRTTIPGETAKGFLGLNPSMVSVQRLDANTNEDRIVVTISNYPFHFFSPWIAGTYTGKPIVASAPTEVE